MKLISEYTESDLEYIVEADEKTGKKNYKIQERKIQQKNHKLQQVMTCILDRLLEIKN